MATCSDCRHHSGDSIGTAGHRQCRAAPPAFALEKSDGSFGGSPVFLACWPLTLPTDHCGGHAPVPTTEPEAPASPAKKPPKGAQA
jgi:hypothetical protein